MASQAARTETAPYRPRLPDPVCDKTEMLPMSLRARHTFMNELNEVPRVT